VVEGRRIVDLTHPFDERTLYWPTSPSTFALTRLHFGPTAAGYFYASNVLCTPEHGGTHLDAPIHFAEKGATAEAIPLERLMASAIVVDFSAAAARDRDALLAREDIVAFESTYGTIERDSIVVIRTGWSKRWPNKREYLGDDAAGDASNLHFPGISAEAAQLLIERGIAAVGIDTASIDHGPSRDFAAHRVLGPANVPAFENLANLEGLPPTGAWVIALPMKIRGGSGGPLRIVALVPR
jgi:kynurenine formamidase